jgi:Na+-translocating ferredoxin:NAD+ oxidoreductase RnfG subunit
LATSSIRVPILIFVVGLAMSDHVVAQADSPSYRPRAESLVRKRYGEQSTIMPVRIALTPHDRDSLKSLNQAAFLPDTLKLIIAMMNKRVLGYAVVDDARGKDQPITYCLLLDSNLVVSDIEILAYREPYGGEVQNSSWLKQFFGKTFESPLRPSKDIRNISGATISSRSITLGVKKVLTLMHIVKDRLPNNTTVH